nr:AsmA family protein [Acidobacteriota bacterium]
MKRGLRIGIAAVAGIAILGVAVPYAPVDFLKAPLERALERGLGRKVEVDAVSLTLFSGPGASLDGVTIHDDPRAGIEPFAYANTLDARISLLGLLHGRLEFSSLHLNDATFNLVKPDNAPWNFEMLLHQTTPAASLPAIKVRGGRVNFKFAQNKSLLYFDDTDLDVSPRADGAVELRFSGVPSRTDQSAQNFGHFYVRGTAAPSLNLRVELEPSALDAVARLFDSRSAGLKGLLSLDAQLSGAPSALDVKGVLQLDGAGEWRVGYKGKLDLSAQTLELDSTSPPGLNTRLHVITRDLLTSPQWEVSANFLDASLGSAVDMARKLGVPLPEKMIAEGVLSGTAHYRNTEGLGGNLEVRDAALTMPDAAPLKIATATIFLKDKNIVAGPNTVQIGDQETADVEATYQAGDGGGIEMKIATRRMNIAELRSLNNAVPLLDRVTGGTWRGTLTYQQPLAAAGAWSGDFEVQNASVVVDGIADPVHVQSASVTVNQGISVSRIRAKAGDIAFTGDYRWSTDNNQPQRFRLQISEASSTEFERLFQ